MTGEQQQQILAIVARKELNTIEKLHLVSQVLAENPEDREFLLDALKKIMPNFSEAATKLFEDDKTKNN